MKTVIIRQLVEKFKLEVLTGENRLNRTISKTRVHRPGLEFAGYYEFFPQERIQVLGLKEIGYLHTLTEEERDARIKNVVK